MRFGNLSLPERVGLAPMAGVTDAAMRFLCHEQGSAWSVSEMLSAKGWVFSQGKNRSAAELLTRFPGEGITGLQLFGREPEYIGRAIESLADRDFSFIDLNFGCPAPKITGNGEGSAMMREPEQIEAVVRAAVRATRLPVTVKIRSGWDADSINAPEIAQRCEQCGAQAVAVHARTRMQQYAGKADWSIIREVKKSVSVPVLGNGDIGCGADAVRMLDETGCDGVIVGRGALGNPWVFREILAKLNSLPFFPPTPDARIQMALRHFDLEVALHGEKKGLLEMRKHIGWYIHGMPGASLFRTAVNKLNTIDSVKDALWAYLEKQR